MPKTKEPMREENIIRVDYEDEIRQSFIDYAMSVIMQRAIPDVRDGLKPVHRRILYAMSELGLDPDKPYRKSARIVGDVLGKYHPHGDTSVYEAMVKMTQDFKMLLPLVQGHGNFGSIDGDSAAAMRYTEAKLGYPALEILDDLEKGVVDFEETYDGTNKEPVVLPSRFPNLLVNGTEGIAVGMKTSIPPHNLQEVIKAVIDVIDHPDIPINKIMKYIKGPDFPTGGTITNQDDLKSIYETGTGNVRIRAKFEIEDAGYGKSNVVVTEIPYTYSGGKEKLIEKLATMARDKKLEELSDLRDESSKDGLRIVLEVKKGIDVQKFLNKLYKKTPLEDTYSVNLLTLVNGRPEVLNLKQIIEHFIAFQRDIVTKKYNYLLRKAGEREEVLSGLIKAHDMIDLIIEILRGSKDVKMAKNCLMNGVTEGVQFKTKKSEKDASKLDFTERQTDAILDMRLQKLISLELEKLNEEYEQTVGNIKEYERVLQEEGHMLDVIKDYLREISKKYGAKRKTVIDHLETEEYVEEFKEEDLYVLIDRFGYVKTTDVANYNRSNDETLKEFKHTFFTKNTDKLCAFTKEGNLHSLKMTDVPKGKIKDKGVPIDTLTKIGKEESLLVDTFQSIQNKHLLFVTTSGMIKWVPGFEFETNRSMIASTKTDDGDSLLAVIPVDKVEQFSHMVVVSKQGYALKFATDDIPIARRTTKGIRTIQLADSDVVTDVYLLDKDVKESKVEVNGKTVNINSMKTKKRNQLGVKVK